MRRKMILHNVGVSEIVGTIMLLIMAIALFSTVYVFIMNEAISPPERSPVTSIVGTTEGTNDIILENRGGEDLPSDTLILLNVAGKMYNMTVSDFSGWDTNGDGRWNIGEKITYSSANIYGLQVEAAVIDPYTDTIVMRGVLQEGGIMEYPYVVTLNYDSIESDRARVWLEYNFRTNYSGKVRISYRSSSSGWMNSSWSALKSGDGTHSVWLNGLIPETTYYYKAQLEYNTKIIEDTQNSFSTLGVIIGWWHLDAGVGTVAFDSSGRNNDGTLYYGPVWQTAVNNTGIEFDGIDDYIKIDDHSSLDVAEAVSIEAWINPLDQSQGQFADIQSLMDTSSFAVFSCWHPNFFHIANDVYGVVYRGDSGHGYINTVSIDNAGSINPTIIDSYKIYGADFRFPNITRVNNDIYAVAFEGHQNDGYVRTVQIFDDGRVNPVIIDTLEYDGSNGLEPNLYHINGDIYAVAYTGANNDGYVATIRISAAGNIDNAVIDKKAFDRVIEVTAVGESKEFNMIHLAGDNYAIAYRNRDSDGEIRTVSITPAGLITSPSKMDGDYVDAYTFDVFDGWNPDIIHVSGEIYGIVYKGFENAGSVRTIRIRNDGAIDNWIDWYKFDTTYGNRGHIRRLNGNWFVMVYTGKSGSNYLGKARTFQLLADGTIDEAGNDTYEFESSYCSVPNILHVSGDIFAVSYTDDNGDGVIKTLEVSAGGAITKSVVDAQEIGIFDCEHPQIMQAQNNIFAMIYRGYDYDGYVRTFEIRNDGSINDTIIDTWEFDPWYAHEPQLYHIDGEIFLIISPSASWHGYARTFRINATGFIFPIDEYEFESVRCVRPHVTHVANDVYAVTYRGPDEDGFVKTLEIATDGTITPAFIDSKEFWGGDIYFPEILHVDNDVYVISFTQKGSNDGYIRTLSILGDGSIGGIIDTSEFDARQGYRPTMLHVNETIYAVFYRGDGNDGFIRTVQIQSDGQITSDWHADGSYYVDSLEYDGSVAYEVTPIYIAGRTYAFVYSDQWRNGWLRTIRIGENGAITNSVDDSYKFIASHGYYPYIMHINGTKYGISYSSSTQDGYVKTINIGYIAKARRVIAKSGAYQLYCNDNTVWGYINSEVLSAPLATGTNYVVLTYDKTLGSDQMKLYVNTTLKAKKNYASAITTNNNHVYMGGVHCLIDEVRLWRSAITQSQINSNYVDLTT